MAYFPHFRTSARTGFHHDRRSGLSRISSCWMLPARFRCSRSRRASPAGTAVDQGVGGDAGPVRSSSGVEMLARGLKPSGAITTLIVAGGAGRAAAATAQKTLAFVRAMAKRGVRIASVCSGAYVLAEAGLLDGRRATTHWRRTRHFLATYPQGEARARPIFTRDGNIWTLGGDHRRHRPGAGDGGGGFRRRDRADRPRASSCSITAAAAASRNSRRCWN